MRMTITEQDIRIFCDRVYCIDKPENIPNAEDTMRIFIEQKAGGNKFLAKSVIEDVYDCIREYGNSWCTFPSLDALIHYEVTDEFNEKYLRNGIGTFIFPLRSGAYLLCTDFMEDEYVDKGILNNRQLNKQIEEYLGIESKYKFDCPKDYEIVMNEARIIQKAYNKELESDNFGYAFYINLPKDIDYEVVTSLTHLTVFRIVNK